jgi:hypothetical protein
MEAMGPWLLMIIAALIALCVALYYQARQVQSEAGGAQRFIADELRDAEAALVAALDRIQRMDSVLSAREKALAAAGHDALVAEPVPTSPDRGASAAESVRLETPTRTSTASLVSSDAQRPPQVEAGADASVEDDAPPVAATHESTTPLDLKPTEPAHGEWRSRAAGLAVAGLTPLQIARELELPVGEVELALALGIWHGPKAAGACASPSQRWH